MGNLLGILKCYLFIYLFLSAKIMSHTGEIYLHYIIACSLCDMKFVQFKSKLYNLQSVDVRSTKHSTENGLISVIWGVILDLPLSLISAVVHPQPNHLIGPQQ